MLAKSCPKVLLLSGLSRESCDAKFGMDGLESHSKNDMPGPYITEAAPNGTRLIHPSVTDPVESLSLPGFSGKNH